MRVKTMLLIFAACVLAASTAFGATTSIPVKGGASQLLLTSDRDDGLRFRIDVGALSALDVSTKAGAFTRITIPGFHASHVEGAPELPMMNRLVAIPYGASARIEVLSVQSRTIDLAAYGVTNPIFPAQPPVSKSADLENLPFLYDRAAYAQPKVAGEMARIVALGSLRSQALGRLEISPVEYLPRENQLVVHESMDVRVVFEGGDRAAGDELFASTYSPFFAPVFANVAGIKTDHIDHPDRVGDKVTMVIVTAPEFEYQLADFATWKTERGFEVIMAVIGTPEVGSTSTSIQTYLHGLYNGATPENPAPSFVLFVGDVAQCPTFTLSGDATDRPYCAVDGDLYPEMYYGRFSATNSAQLQAQLDKTMMYDQFTMPDPGYLSDVTMIAGVDAGYAPTHGNGQINYGTEHYFNAAHGITSNTYLYPASDAPGAAAAIVQDCQNGIGYINYTAHGSTTSWSDPSYTQSNINSLSNYGKYFLAVGNCCLTSSYDIGECFGETFLRATDKGAVGYIGGSNSTYWNEDYWWGVGFHASSQIDGTAWPVESTGIGAYDGVFHDHGEAPAQWYVTNDAVVFCGNMAVTEAGSSIETYYWNIYNLLGDPSLSTYMGVPATNPVSHMPTFFTNAVSIDVDAAPGSYVGLTQGGVLLASGTIDAGGKALFDLDGFLTPGTAKLVVMMQNYEPYVVDVPVIVPATVIIDPTSIDANVATDVTVTVYGEDGVTPVVGLDVWAEGLGYATTPLQTDALGVAVINVNYPFGPTIDIVGKNAADPYELFRELLTVNALALASPDLTVTTGIGMTDMFPLNLPGTLHATVAEGGHTLYAVLPDDSELSTGDYSLEITPAETGVITGIIAVSGYDLYSEDFDVIEAYGTLTGHVDAAGSPAVGAIVQLFDGAVEMFSATTDASGDYDIGEDILVDDYSVVVDFFGYNHYETPLFVNYGANVHDIALTSAPSGVLAGVVMDSETSELLEATINVYRSDNGELYTTTTSDGVTGAYATSALPYFEYSVNVRAYHHIPVNISVEISEPTVVKNFALDPTVGDVLVIDDTPAGKVVPAKYGEDGRLLAPAYERSGAKSADLLVADLEYLGYGVVLETIATTDPASWPGYDVLLVSAGDNTSSLSDAAFRDAMVAYADVGGHILLEGGEVGYNHYSDTDFAERVMHSTDWNHDSSGMLEVADPSHYVMSVPNVLSGGNVVTYVGYGDQDALALLPDAQLAGNWSTYPTDGGVICYDTNTAPEGGQIVFFTFNYAALATSCTQNLLQNAITWLVTPEFGDALLSGTVTLDGETDHSGVLVELIPAGLSTTTDVTGYYEFADIFGGDYTVSVSKEHWHPQSAVATVPSGGSLTGFDFTLLPVFYGEFTGNVSEILSAKLVATIEVVDTATSELVASVVSDAGTGDYATGPVPYGNYNLTARAFGYAPQTFNLELATPTMVQDFALATTSGSILLIDDHVAAKTEPDKLDDKGKLLAPGYQSSGKAVDTMVAELEGLGFTIEVETMAGTDPLNWTSYDMLIVTSGNNTTTLADATFRSNLVAFVQGGGHLLLEGGEVGYDHYYSDPVFAAEVMHVTGWTGDSSGDVTVADPYHYVMSVPNLITGPIAVTYVGYGDEDALPVAAGAVKAGGWTEDSNASVVCYDPTSSPVGGQIVFFTFNYTAMDAGSRVDLLQNAVIWLLATEEPGTAAISGTVELLGELDHSGTLVELLPGGGSLVTGPDGAYAFTGLFAGTYALRASHAGWGTGNIEVTFAVGEVITGFDLILNPEYNQEFCSTPALAIPDNTPAGITDAIAVSLNGGYAVSGVEVFVDITHTWQGDLIVALTSPGGTTITLHNRTGSSVDDIFGWYPTELDPEGDLDDFVGEDTDGDWTLFVSDNASLDTGTLNEWCMSFSYAQPVPVGAGAMTASSGSEGVMLIWEYEPALVDGFHVYRRTAGEEAQRLTGDALSNAEGRIEYLDVPYGIAPGSKLYYSYALVVDGVETDRGAEVEVVYNGTPARFVMHRNYPNPFNPTTSIKFELPKPGHAKLMVYDLSGRMVRTLVDENLPAAVHQRQWDGTNDQGRRVASGTYYFRLTADGHTAVQKVMLVK
ncbi:proprotein convertase P-domain-containing protein [bacterium]|nr:proprotein convertase P-domain-containing protein [bacterium]